MTPNTASIIATVASEFTLFLEDCAQQSYDFNTEIHSSKSEKATIVRLLLEGDGLSVWVNGEGYETADMQSLEGELYQAIRHLPVVKATIAAINRRHDQHDQ